MQYSYTWRKEVCSYITHPVVQNKWMVDQRGVRISIIHCNLHRLSRVTCTCIYNVNCLRLFIIMMQYRNNTFIKQFVFFCKWCSEKKCCFLSYLGIIFIREGGGGQCSLLIKMLQVLRA